MTQTRDATPQPIEQGDAAGRRPLEGIRVFDLTVAMVGPWASLQLGLLGAEVIHIEQPNVDPATLGAGVPPLVNGTSIGYIAWNLNKRGLFLDLKSDFDREIAYRLLKNCDVLIQNMRPGVMARLGMDYEKVRDVNPRLIYCSISGWGEDGPMLKLLGADPQAQAFTGFISLNGREGGDPEFSRYYAPLDGLTGTKAAEAVLMALAHREETGEGELIELNMLQASMDLQTTRFSEYFATGKVPPRLGSVASVTAPNEAFRCADGRHLAVSVTNDKHWRAFCSAVQRGDLVDEERFQTNPRRVENRVELSELLADHFASLPAQWWTLRLRKAKVPCGRLMDFNELWYHQQVVANGYIQDLDSEVWGDGLRFSGPPWKLDGTNLPLSPTPLPGEHTAEILDELLNEESES